MKKNRISVNGEDIGDLEGGDCVLIIKGKNLLLLLPRVDQPSDQQLLVSAIAYACTIPDEELLEKMLNVFEEYLASKEGKK